MRTLSTAARASDFSPLFLSTPFNAELSAGTQTEVPPEQCRNPLLDVREIPSNNQITRLLDNLEPEWFAESFNHNLILAEQYGVLEEYRVLDGGVRIALDGVWYFSSENVHCGHCLHKTKDGETTYYHGMAAGAVVKPGGGVALPLMPEMIRNGDGQEKQDCQRNAAKGRL